MLNFYRANLRNENKFKASETDIAQTGVPVDKVLKSFSATLSLADNKIILHGHRLAYLSLSLGLELGLKDQDLEVLHNASLLHDIGVKKMAGYRFNKLANWEPLLKHGQLAATRVGRLPRWNRVANVLKYHHLPWEKHSTKTTVNNDSILSNILFLADYIDQTIDYHKPILLNFLSHEKYLNNIAGLYFWPEAVQALREITSSEYFWLGLAQEHIADALDRLYASNSKPLTLPELTVVAEIFAQVVDAKSIYAKNHSRGVGLSCRYFGEKLGFDSLKVSKLYIAGLLHDLGKLAIPEWLLDKPGPFSKEEFLVVKAHPYITYQALCCHESLADIRDWAAFHHERPDGNGYPFHLTKDHLSIEHFIVTISDRLQAVMQNRPHRPYLKESQALDIFEHLATNHADISTLVEIIKRDYQHFTELLGEQNPS